MSDQSERRAVVLARAAELAADLRAMTEDEIELLRLHIPEDMKAAWRQIMEDYEARSSRPASPGVGEEGAGLPRGVAEPAERDRMRDALAQAADALKPVANWVLNDNGDVTVSYGVLSYEQVVEAWKAERRARSLVASAEDGAGLAAARSSTPLSPTLSIEEKAEPVARSLVVELCEAFSQAIPDSYGMRADWSLLSGAERTQWLALAKFVSARLKAVEAERDAAVETHDGLVSAAQGWRSRAETASASLTTVRKALERLEEALVWREAEPTPRDVLLALGNTTGTIDSLVWRWEKSRPRGWLQTLHDAQKAVAKRSALALLPTDPSHAAAAPTIAKTDEEAGR